MFNVIILQGRLTNDVRLTKLESGTIANFRIAVNERRSDETLFINVVAFRGLADICGEHLVKGDEVLVSGRLQRKEKDDKEFFEVVAQDVEFLRKSEKTPHDFM